MAVREDLMDVLTHEYGYFIHRHAEADYVQKSKVFRAKELGGGLMNGDWKYNINTRYSAKAKIDAAKISKYATENPYEAFAEGFLGMDKGEKIPDNIEKVVNVAKTKAGAKNVAKETGSGIMKNIRIPSAALSAKNITADIVDEIQSGIDGILLEYDAKIAFISVRDMSIQFPDTPYMIQSGDDSGMKRVDFIINSGFDFNGFREVVSAGYESGYFAGKSIKDHAIHEMAHAMAGQQYKTISAFRDFVKRLEGHDSFCLALHGDDLHIRFSAWSAQHCNCSAWCGCAYYLFPTEWCDPFGHGIFD